jgi:hypothetical protein
MIWGKPEGAAGAVEVMAGAGPVGGAAKVEGARRAKRSGRRRKVMGGV